MWYEGGREEKKEFSKGGKYIGKVWFPSGCGTQGIPIILRLWLSEYEAWGFKKRFFNKRELIQFRFVYF